MDKFRDIVYISENEPLCIVDESEIDNIFEPIKDKQVSIITVCGTSKNRRIFIIDLIIKLLIESFNGKWLKDEENFDLFDDSDDDLFDSDNDDSKDVTDNFQADSGGKTSIVRLSKPFSFRLEDGSEKILFILDTDGSSAGRIKDKFWFAYHGLCLSVSSFFILNVPDILEESYGLSLELIMRFTKTFMNIDETFNNIRSKPLKSILFLIESRSVKNAIQFDLRSVDQLETLNRKHLPKELNYEFFKKYFNELFCFLTMKNDNQNTNDRELKSSFTQLINTDRLSSPRIENEAFTGEMSCSYIKTYLSFFKNNPKEEISRDGTFLDTSLLQFKKFKANYTSKFTRKLSNDTSFLSRVELVKFHNSLVTQMFKNLVNKEAIMKSPDCQQLVLKCFDTLTFSFAQIFKLNEDKRKKCSELKFKESCDMFLEKLMAYGNINEENTNEFDELLKVEQNASISNFESIFGEEPDLFEADLKNLKLFIENSITTFKKRVGGKKKEEKANKTKNSNAVSDSISFYESAIQNLFDKNPYLNRKDFQSQKKKIEIEAHEMFLHKCVYGSESEKNICKAEFVELLQEINSKYKKQIEDKENKVIANINEELNNAISHYETTMKSHMETYLNITSLSNYHKLTLNIAVNKFKSNCINKDDNFIDKYLIELKAKIELVFEGLLKKHEEIVENIESNYKQEVIRSKAKYINVMDKLLNDNQYVEIEKFTHISEQEMDKIINDFENMHTTKTPSFATNITQLKNLLSNEHKKLLVTNSQNKDKIHENARKLCKQLSEKYEDEMFKAYKKLEKENELESLHENIKRKVIDEFKAKSLFTNKQLITPYLSEIEENTRNSLRDFKDLLKEYLAKQKAETENILRDVKVMYVEEMNKYLSGNSYTSKANLKKFHDKTIVSIVSHFKDKKQNLSIEKFNDLINTSLNKSFLLILEENNKNTPAIPAIGIDMGTTNTVIAYYRPGTPYGQEIIIQNEGANTTPSVVAFTDEGEFVGTHAKENSYIDPRNTVFSIKRLIGRNFNETSVQDDMKYLPYKIVGDDNNKPVIEVKSRGSYRSFVPEQISAKVLVEMKKVAQQHFRIPITNVVITVPAYFNDSQKQATKDAAQIAGLVVLDIIPEPVAAALAFKLKNSNKDKRKVLVYDLGGGTFDVAVLLIEAEKIEVLSINGDYHLGGDDFDKNLIEYCLNEFYKINNIRVNNSTREGSVSFYRLKCECEKKKQVLSVRNTATIIVDNFHNNKDLRIEITRDIFETINYPLFKRTITLLNDALDKAHMTHSDIDDMVLVGGSSKIPKVREMLGEIFPNRQINYTVNADEAVALGASVQAAILNGIKAQELGQLKIYKIAPMSLGIELHDKTMSKIIEHNSRIPIKVTKEYTTVLDNQTSVLFPVFEGEESIAKNNRELGRFVLTDVPPAPAGEKKIDVTFDIKDDGILFVTATLRGTNNSREISIIQHKGRLSLEELQKFIEEEFHNQNL